MYTSNIETFFGVNILVQKFYLYIKVIFRHINLMQFIFLVAFFFLSDNILVHKTNVCLGGGERKTERERQREKELRHVDNILYLK